MASRFPAPDGLSERSQKLWSEIVPRRARSAGRLALIGEALKALDRAEQAAEIVNRDGFTFTTKTTGTVHLSPMVKVEREQRALFAKIWSGLCHLEWDCNIDGVPYRPEDWEDEDEEAASPCS